MENMKIHNLMEEFVTSHVNAIYDQLVKQKPVWLSCDCADCRIDAVSYVLNRTPPRYVVSGRGIIHSGDLFNSSQLRADVDALAVEGIRLINSVQRPYHKTPQSMAQSSLERPSFNFPIFMGAVFDGSTFEPLPNAKITLKKGDELAPMLDKTWNNPCMTYAATKGAYSFWVMPVDAEKTEASERFTFTLEVAAQGYVPACHAVDIAIVSEPMRRMEMNSSYSLKIQDIFLFREDIQNPMEG